MIADQFYAERLYSAERMTQMLDAAGFRAEEIPGLDDDRYGAADDGDPET